MLDKSSQPFKPVPIFSKNQIVKMVDMCQLIADFISDILVVFPNVLKTEQETKPEKLLVHGSLVRSVVKPMTS